MAKDKREDKKVKPLILLYQVDKLSKIAHLDLFKERWLEKDWQIAGGREVRCFISETEM